MGNDELFMYQRGGLIEDPRDAESYHTRMTGSHQGAVNEHRIGKIVISGKSAEPVRIKTPAERDDSE